MVNRAIIVGNLGRDPELKQAGSTPVCTFSVATSKKWTDESGEKKENTTWHNIVCFRKTAEFASKYLKKGSSVFIEGEIQNRSYDDKDGVKKYTSEILASNIQFVGPRPEGVATQSGSEATPNKAGQKSGYDVPNFAPGSEGF